MRTNQPQSGAGLEEVSRLERVRRPRMKDSLLAENPPRVLGAAIMLIAALLVMAAAAARNIEYQESIPISLVLRADEMSGSAYGEGLLPQSQAAKVKPDQPIFMELAPSSGADNVLIEGQVSQVTMTRQNLYQVRVKLPANFNSNQENTRILRQEAPIQGRIMTGRGKLFRRMFTLFSNL